MSKTRLQFLVALFLIVLPLLGFPTAIDMIIVSFSGLIIAATTFLSARERRIKTRLGVSIDPIKKQIRTVRSGKRTAKKSEAVDEDVKIDSSVVEEAIKEIAPAPKKKTRVASPIFTETGVRS